MDAPVQYMDAAPQYQYMDAPVQYVDAAPQYQYMEAPVQYVDTAPYAPMSYALPTTQSMIAYPQMQSGPFQFYASADSPAAPPKQDKPAPAKSTSSSKDAAKKTSSSKDAKKTKST